MRRNHCCAVQGVFYYADKDCPGDGRGVILFGVKDKTGEMLGLTFKQLQDTGLELGNTANVKVWHS